MHPESCILHPASPPLSRAEYRELAQLYFWTWRDREGFAQVLDGITLLGIDNDLGVRDPMVDCFLNNIMRADDAEIQRFYDLLGYAITQARALKGDEKYLAFLLRTRGLISEYYDHINPADDVEMLRASIEAARNKLEREPASAVANRSTQVEKPQLPVILCNVLSNTTKKTPDVSYAALEDTMMSAYLYAKRGDTGRARLIALELAVQCTNEGVKVHVFNGQAVAAAVQHLLQNQDCIVAVDSLPEHHPQAVRGLAEMTLLCLRTHQWQEALVLFRDLAHRSPAARMDVWDYVIAVHAARDDCAAAAAVALDGLIRSADGTARARMLERTKASIGWARRPDMDKCLNAMRGLLVEAQTRMSAHPHVIGHAEDMLRAAPAVRELYALCDTHVSAAAQPWIDSAILHTDSGGFYLMKARMYAESGMTNSACVYALKAYERRAALVRARETGLAVKGGAECELLNVLLPHAALSIRTRHAEWLSNHTTCAHSPQRVSGSFVDESHATADNTIH